MVESCAILTRFCHCQEYEWWKIRFYDRRISLDITLDGLPRFDGIADLMIDGNKAHISGFIMSGYSRFKRMHDVDLEKMIRLNFPDVTVVYWERHKGGEVVKLMRELS